MAEAVIHGGSRVTRGGAPVAATVGRWPRGLAAIGLLSLLVSAWGAIVPFLGPAIGYHADNTSAWEWTSQHAWLYLLPGVVGAVVSLAVVGRSRRGRWAARVSLAILGLALAACGAWFVLGPAAWPLVGSGAVYSADQSASSYFTATVGYNLGVGLVLVLFAGMVLKASVGEREVLWREEPVAETGRSVPSGAVDPAVAAATGAGTQVVAGVPAADARPARRPDEAERVAAEPGSYAAAPVAEQETAPRHYEAGGGRREAERVAAEPGSYADTPVAERDRSVDLRDAEAAPVNQVPAERPYDSGSAPR